MIQTQFNDSDEYFLRTNRYFQKNNRGKWNYRWTAATYYIDAARLHLQ